jgi:hypothetical protein
MIGADTIAYYSDQLEKKTGETGNFREARRLLYQLKIELSRLKEPLSRITSGAGLDFPKAFEQQAAAPF